MYDNIKNMTIQMKNVGTYCREILRFLQNSLSKSKKYKDFP